MSGQEWQLSLLKVNDTGRKVGDKQLTVYDVIVAEDFDGDIQTLSEKAAEALRKLVGKGKVPITLDYQREFNGRRQFKVIGCEGYTYGQGAGGGGGGGGGGWSPERTAQVQRGNALNAAAAAAQAGEDPMSTLARAEAFLDWLKQGTSPPSPPASYIHPAVAEAIAAETVPLGFTAEPALPSFSEAKWEGFVEEWRAFLSQWQSLDPNMGNQELQNTVLKPWCAELGFAYPITKGSLNNDQMDALRSLIGARGPGLIASSFASTGVGSEL